MDTIPVILYELVHSIIYKAVFFISCIIIVLYAVSLFARYRKRKKLLHNDSSGMDMVDGHVDPGAVWRQNRLLALFGVQNVAVIADNFMSLTDISDTLKNTGLEATNLIFGIDFTISNMHQGVRTFNGKNLHAIDGQTNPYQEVICILGETLEPFDEDGYIPAFGFGDRTTKDHAVFPFNEKSCCKGFREVLHAYNRIVQKVSLSGPTNLAPLIYASLEIVKATKSYHILVIVADGQVICERPTRQAIIDASHWPLSIIMIGVGDGPWDTMVEFDDSIKGRHFDNFQFVDFHKVMQNSHKPRVAFALNALMEIPDQYATIKKLNLLQM